MDLRGQIQGLRGQISGLRVDIRPKTADFKSYRADIRPERAWGADGRMNKSLPVFYRTLSPLRPLSNYHSVSWEI